MRKSTKTKAISKTSGDLYLDTAKDFFESMNLCLDFENWNAVGLNGIHCAISLCDALLAKKKGLRNISQNDSDATDLLKMYIHDSDTEKQAKRLEKIIRIKNLVEYEGDPFTEKQARDLSEKVERFYDWGLRVFKSRT